MYNRYIPQNDGSFRRNRVPEPPKREDPPCPPPAPECPPVVERPPMADAPRNGSVTGFLRQLLPKGFDTGDLLIVLLILLMAGDCAEEQNTALLTLALYFFL